MELQPHVLLLPCPYLGHMNPLLRLGKNLAALGLQVTIATLPHLHQKLTQAQQSLAQPTINGQLDINLESIDAGVPPELDCETSRAVWYAMTVTMEGGVLKLIQTVAEQGRPVTCIVCDYFLSWTASLAQRTGLPEFVFFPMSFSVFSIYTNVDAILAAGYDPFEANISATAPRTPSMESISCIPGLPQPIHPAHMPFRSGTWGKEWLQWLLDVIEHRNSFLPRAAGVVLNSSLALEPEVNKLLILRTHEEQLNCPSRMRFVGPLVFNGPAQHGEASPVQNGEIYKPHVPARNLVSFWEKEEEECLQWLDVQPVSSVIYVSFGSVNKYSIEQAREIACGLVASGQRFLWVIRKDAFTSAETSKGNGIDEDLELEEVLPQGFLELERGKVVRWAPQVLSHPVVGGFLSHCGWNSAMESICAGIPILGWPYVMDQETTCWLLSHVWKTGVRLETDLANRASAENVEKGVRELMEGPGSEAMRARARELSRLVAHEEGASSTLKDQLMALVDDIRAIHSANRLI